MARFAAKGLTRSEISGKTMRLLLSGLETLMFIAHSITCVCHGTERTLSRAHAWVVHVHSCVYVCMCVCIHSVQYRVCVY